jgi:hypothetical protein
MKLVDVTLKPAPFTLKRLCHESMLFGIRGLWSLVLSFNFGPKPRLLYDKVVFIRPQK